METITAFIKRNKLEVRAQRIAARPDDNEGWGKNASHWIVTFEKREIGGTVQAFLFTQGSAHTKAPTGEDVLDCLKSDASAHGLTFEQWADETGYDRDSRKAEVTYRACLESARKLLALLGPVELASLQQTESL